MNNVYNLPDEPDRPAPTLDPYTSTASAPPSTQPVDTAAYSTFYRKEIRALVNFLLWMGSGAADATDLAQETMIDAYRSWPTIHHPRAWIRRVASRKYGRLLDCGERSAGLRTDDHSALLVAPDNISAWEQRHEVLRLLAGLPPRQRQVMAWFYDGYRPHEIATELGLTPETVRTTLHRARQTLTEHLHRGGTT